MAISDAISPTDSITFIIRAFGDSFGHCALVLKLLNFFFYSVCNDTLNRLSKHYQAEGLTPIKRKKGTNMNHPHRLSLDDTRRIQTFITNFAEDHAVALPGRVPGFRQEDIRLLPSSYPKCCKHRLYNKHAQNDGMLSTFLTIYSMLHISTI